LVLLSVPPPSYFDAVFTEAHGNAVQLNEASEHTMGTKPFLPRYPVYGLNTLLNDEGSTSQNEQPSSHTNIGFVQKY
jgi:hypothetical protein